MLTIDASAAVRAALAQTGFGELRGQELVAPPLVISESTSTLHRLRWTNVLAADVAGEALARLLDAPIGIRRPKDLPRTAWEVADELGWARTYDAEYVALARILDCPLLTIDARLARSASRLVQIVRPDELTP